MENQNDIDNEVYLLSDHVNALDKGGVAPTKRELCTLREF